MDTLFLAQSAGARPALPLLWWLGPIGAVLALGYAYYFYQQVTKESEGTERMIEIADAIRDGAMAYLTRQYRVVGLVFAALFILFLVLSFLNLQNPIVPFAFLTGGIFSGLCGYFGMKTATNASARAAHAASQSLNGGLQIALKCRCGNGVCCCRICFVGHYCLVPDSILWFSRYFPIKLH